MVTSHKSLKRKMPCVKFMRGHLIRLSLSPVDVGSPAGDGIYRNLSQDDSRFICTPDKDRQVCKAVDLCPVE